MDMVFILLSGTVGEGGRVSLVVDFPVLGQSLEKCRHDDVLSSGVSFLESAETEDKGTNLVETDVGGLLTEALTADVHL